ALAMVIVETRGAAQKRKEQDRKVTKRADRIFRKSDNDKLKK
ncbi:4972_t:CDS:1, partial [Cetraspora pellucida]